MSTYYTLHTWFKDLKGVFIVTQEELDNFIASLSAVDGNDWVVLSAAFDTFDRQATTVAWRKDEISSYQYYLI